MATNKTIQPTNVTVQIPALSDVPDMSVPANAIDKAIDGINALNSQIAKYQGTRAWVAGANCNDYTTEGLYMLSDNLTNAPLTWFTLIVYAPRNDAITQIAMKTPNEIYVRFYTSSWSVWDKLALNSQLVKTAKVTYTPSSNLAAGESGYFTVPVPAAVKGKTIVAVSFGVNHVAQSYGYQLTGTYISTLDSAYVSYYSPRAVTAANADFDMIIAYI